MALRFKLQLIFCEVASALTHQKGTHKELNDYL